MLVKSPNLFMLIEKKTIGLTLCSKCMYEIGWSKSKELDGTQGDRDNHK